MNVVVSHFDCGAFQIDTCAGYVVIVVGVWEYGVQMRNLKPLNPDVLCNNREAAQDRPCSARLSAKNYRAAG